MGRMTDMNGKEVGVNDLVKVWQPTFERWVVGRVSSLHNHNRSVDVCTCDQTGATITPKVCEVVVLDTAKEVR